VATQKQMEANRRNAKRSAGPRTSEGKATSRLNALKHGLLSETLVVPGLEQPEDWTVFRDELLASLEPSGGLEELLAQRVIAAAWRLSRAERYERDMIDAKVSYSRWTGVEPRRGDLSASSDDNDIESRGPRGGQLPDLDALMGLTRYESHLHRQFIQCLHELQRVQARRLGAEVTVPGALDVTITGNHQESDD
jgi:hypothetical protein